MTAAAQLLPRLMRFPNITLEQNADEDRRVKVFSSEQPQKGERARLLGVDSLSLQVGDILADKIGSVPTQSSKCSWSEKKAAPQTTVSQKCGGPATTSLPLAASGLPAVTQVQRGLAGRKGRQHSCMAHMT